MSNWKSKMEVFCDYTLSHQDFFFLTYDRKDGLTKDRFSIV